jgi:nucleoside 2-deoxyribosyltransferase
VKHKVEERDSQFVIQSHHLQAIALSDFLWLHAPDGYIGTSGAMEIGYAVAKDIPIFSSETPKDETLKHFVTIVPSVFRAIEQLPT